MSFDLVIFDSSIGYLDRKHFLDRYDKDSGSINVSPDPDRTSEELTSWFSEMIKKFPAMNGRFALRASEHNSYTTDYNCGDHCIWAGFAWSVSDEALQLSLATAEKFGLCVFNTSSDLGEVYAPDSNGKLRIIHSGWAEAPI